MADSENDRVVEYRQRPDDSWELVWHYSGALHWPRDADRLPNGNTLIVDTYGQRVLEVTPEKEIVWEREIAKMPYDVERLQYGDEPRGPAIDTAPAGATAGEASPSLARDLYAHALWVLPVWIGFWEFYALVGAVLVGGVWVGAELVIATGVVTRVR